MAIIEPWFSKPDWKKGSVHMRTCESCDLKIARVGFNDLRGNDSVLDERIVVAEKGRGISYYRDRQVKGLFEQKKFLRLMREAGFRPKYIKKSLAPGRGLYVGVRMSSLLGRIKTHRPSFVCNYCKRTLPLRLTELMVSSQSSHNQFVSELE